MRRLKVKDMNRISPYQSTVNIRQIVGQSVTQLTITYR